VCDFGSKKGVLNNCINAPAVSAPSANQFLQSAQKNEVIVLKASKKQKV
jgi:hypothetical protein